MSTLQIRSSSAAAAAHPTAHRVTSRSRHCSDTMRRDAHETKRCAEAGVNTEHGTRAQSAAPLSAVGSEPLHMHYAYAYMHMGLTSMRV